MKNAIQVSGKRAAWPILLTALVALAWAQPASAAIKKSIAVAPTQWQAAATVGWITGEAITAQLITELDKTGRYRVVERENLDGMLKEQDLGAAGRTRKGSGPKVGDLEGAQMMIKCVITDAEEESGKGGSVGFGGISLGGKKTVYRVTMDVRIYDTQTGLILGTATVSAEQVKKKKSGGVGFGKLRLGGSKSGGDTTGAIIRDLLKEAIAAVDQQSEALGWKSAVISIKGDKIIILGGTRDGLEKGMKFAVYSLGEAIIDDDTGEVLDEGEETQIGQIELTSIKDKVAYATMTNGQNPEKGNVVRLLN